MKRGSVEVWKPDVGIRLENYDQRMQSYGQAFNEGVWPFLSRDPRYSATADEHAWDVYFRDHLRGFPPTYQLYRDGVIKCLNVPTKLPEEFDRTYVPSKMIYDARYSAE